jgi:hypothetical protein
MNFGFVLRILCNPPSKTSIHLQSNTTANPPPPIFFQQGRVLPSYEIAFPNRSEIWPFSYSIREWRRLLIQSSVSAKVSIQEAVGVR